MWDLHILYSHDSHFLSGAHYKIVVMLWYIVRHTDISMCSLAIWKMTFSGHSSNQTWDECLSPDRYHWTDITHLGQSDADFANCCLCRGMMRWPCLVYTVCNMPLFIYYVKINMWAPPSPLCNSSPMSNEKETYAGDTYAGVLFQRGS